MRPLFSFLLVLTLLCPYLGADTLKCPVCGMNFSEKAKTRFETQIAGKKVTVCSFACAHKLKHKHPELHLHVFDFGSSEKVDAENATYFTKSDKLLKLLEFNMAPSVVSYGNENDAKALQKQLGEGVVVKGWKKLEELYE